MAGALLGQYDLEKYSKSFAAPYFFIHNVSQNIKLTQKKQNERELFNATRIANICITARENTNPS